MSHQRRVTRHERKVSTAQCEVGRVQRLRAGEKRELTSPQDELDMVGLESLRGENEITSIESAVNIDCRWLTSR